VAEKACKFVGMDLKHSRIITCHLGNGSSVTAIRNGESVDTSMGFTPVEGVVMGTRCGNLDVGAVTFIQEKEKMDYSQVNALLNKKSGLLGISGVSSDNRDIEAAAATGNERAELARKMLSYSIKKYVGAYAAALGGVDLIVFTGGIGENAWPVREQVCAGLEFLGIDFDTQANQVRGKDVVLTRPGSKVKVVAVTTNEELVIATDTMNLVRK
jgi:acetate kinase